jgi:phosphoribosylformylglycinamidine cyclo-ligase
MSHEKSSQPQPVGDSTHYRSLGVSATKADVYGAIENLPVGISKNTFCKVLPDVFGGSDDYVNVVHADGAGSKSILAYLLFRLTGRLDGFRHIAQDAIVMNLDDMICVGATSRFLLTSIINRNAARINGTILREIIQAKQEFVEKMSSCGITMSFVGGETADVGDVVKTLLVDATLSSRFPRSELLINEISPGLAIVGLSSFGSPATYESTPNSGISSNGITLARHKLLGRTVVDRFPEIYEGDQESPIHYRGPFEPLDILPGTNDTVLDALLSPTRTYAPVLREVFQRCRTAVKAVVHNTGGAHTKCLRFARGCTIRKNLGEDIPPIFRAIQKASSLPWTEMAKVFNLGIRMEIYCDAKAVNDIISIASVFGVQAKLMGHTFASPSDGDGTLQLSILGVEHPIS